MSENAIIGIGVVILVLLGLMLLDTWGARRPGGGRAPSLLERVAMLEGRMTALEQTMLRIDGKLDTILRAQAVAAEISRQVAQALDERKGRGRGGVNIRATNVEAVADRIGRMDDRRGTKEDARD